MEITFNTESSKDWATICKICNKRCQSQETMQSVLDAKKCSKCGDTLTTKELSYCKSHQEELDGILVCYDCQRKK